MTIILSYILFIGTMAVSIFRPWIGVVAVYLLAIWVPLAIRPWVFGQFRVVYYVALSTILGFIVAAITGKIDFAALRSKQNLYLIILWLCLVISYLFSPYEITPTNLPVNDPNYLIQNMSKVILFYFIAILTIDNKRKCHFLVWVMLFTTIHFIYYGNMEYFGGGMRGLHNTLIGPGYKYVVSVYVDENAFAMFYVMSIPFLFFMGRYYKNKALKWFLWLNIPFAWHCIFLTGSRGGLLGLSVVTLFITLRSKIKIIGLAIPVLLVLAYIYQSGSTMKDRAKSAIEVEQDSSVQARFNSWEAGIKMAMKHPITGVGIGNFVKAYPDYADTKPFVAHNTIIQFAAECGVVAGLMYLFLCSGIFLNIFKYKKFEALNIDPFILALKESLMGGLAGFFVCSLFLNLATYELFYYSLVLYSVQARLASTAFKNIDSNKLQPELT